MEWAVNVLDAIGWSGTGLIGCHSHDNKHHYVPSHPQQHQQPTASHEGEDEHAEPQGAYYIKHPVLDGG